MGHCQAALLADRAVFRMTGTDARKFLQGMLTNDVGKLSDGEAMHAGLLAPQGKILFELFVVAHYSAVEKADLTAHRYESGTSIKAGFRWYFFQNLGLGLEHESGDIDVTTISMRFSFGNLPL